MKIGNCTIEGPLMLAPLAGYTDSPFRRIARRHGAGLTMSELVSVEGIVRSNAKTMNLMRFTDEERPFALQIFGKDPGIMADAAVIVEEKLSPDIIDINMGCPAKRVCNSGSGSALLADPALVRIIAESVVKKVSLPVTAKIRLGWDDSSRNYVDIVRALEDGGVSAVFVHGRTRSQFYSGAADWDAIREICRMTELPVIGNGDISTYKEAGERVSFSGCPGVLIGRGALGNPWIFSGTTPTLKGIADQALEHLDMMIGHYGQYGIILMRKHLVNYIRSIPGARGLRKNLVIATERDDIRDILGSLGDSDASVDKIS